MNKNDELGTNPSNPESCLVILDTRKHKTGFWIMLAFGAVALAAWFYFSEVSLYGGKQVALLQEFLQTNSVVRNAVGEYRSVRLDRRRGSVSGYGDNLSGTYYFIMQTVAGDDKETRVDWQYKGGVFLVERVYLVSRWEQKVIFDESQTNSVLTPPGN